MTVLSWLKRNNIIKCNHRQNYKASFYAIKDVPYISKNCEDCGFLDEGHVYGDTNGWYGFIVVKSGKIIKDTRI